MVEMSDFPKLHCPFIRQTFKVNKDHFKKFGNRYQLRTPEVYLAVDRVNPGYEWVFDDPDTFVVEKLDGTNVKLLTEKGRLVGLQNRKNIIDPLQIVSGKTFIIEGIFRAIGKGYVKEDGEQAGELIGPKVQANPYRMDFHEWYPFDKTIKDLRYNCFHDYERTFDNWSSWFKDWLKSRYYQKRLKMGTENDVFAEGVIFYNLRRKAENLPWRAKLRRNMFDWFFTPEIGIYDYDKKGRDEVENQENFD